MCDSLQAGQGGLSDPRGTLAEAWRKVCGFEEKTDPSRGTRKRKGPVKGTSLVYEQ